MIKVIPKNKYGSILSLLNRIFNKKTFLHIKYARIYHYQVLNLFILLKKKD
jgi:hypothetical protein